MKRKHLFTLLLAWGMCCGMAWLGQGLLAADAPNDPVPGLPPAKPVPYLTPEEELKTFQLPEGYRLELVLSDPDIKEPVVCVFDGNGRMYVDELRTYMQDIDGTGEMEPGGRVSRHESTKGDGKFDKHTVFADHLLLPRMVLPLDDRVLINETNTTDIYAYRDSNGDGVADQKELFFAGGPRGGNLEHQQSGLVWGLDNWIYQAVNTVRLRCTGKEVLKETTPGNGGQWGLCQDDYGKMWFCNAGGEKGPLHYQTPIIYGGLDVSGQNSPDFPEVWPLVGLADVQGGPSRFRPENKTLNHFTATCGQQIFRGDRLPADLRGDLLFGEPVGRLIRRAKIEDHEGMTYLRNAYDKSEFIRSTDPNFRPVNMATGPDGCLYIVDMYRGIIQEGNWTRAGSFLRPMVQRYSLDKNFGRGRIWRLVHKDFQPGPQPKMLDETPAQLVAHLEHPNGWWRDTAQKLIILRGDKSVIPAITAMSRDSKNPLARIHAIWTLEGLDAFDAALMREKLKDADPKVRVAAIRAGESLLKKGDKSLTDDVQAMAKDPDPGVVLQTLLTGKLLDWPDYSKFAEFTLSKTSAKGVRAIGALVLNSGHGIEDRQYTAVDAARMHKGETIYQELCFACHGYDGKGMPLEGAAPGTTMAPPLAGSRDVLDNRETPIRILLSGLTGHIGGKDYLAQMVAMNSNDDEWVASITSYVRNSFGNRAPTVTPEEVKRIREQTKSRTTPWTLEELHALVPQPLADSKAWKFSASHNPNDAKLMADGKFDTRWTTKMDQIPGMWVQVELPKETEVVGLLVDASKSTNDYPRAYKVEVSADGEKWGKPVAQGKGTPGITEIRFAPVKAKFIRLTQTGSLKAKETGVFWSIQELEVLQPASGG